MTEKQCHKCLTKNPDDAIYCKQCGANIQNPFITKKVESTEILLIVGLSLLLFSTLFWLTPSLIHRWWEVLRILAFIMSLFAAVGPVLIANAIKGNTAKIIFIILAAILGIWSIASTFINYFLY
jgi:hypothetical protein